MSEQKKQFRFRIPWIAGSSIGFQSRRKQRSKFPSQLAYSPPHPPPTPIYEPQTTLERNMMFAIATSNPSEKNIKLVADPVTVNESKSLMQNSTMKDDVTNFANKVATVNPTTATQFPTDDKTVSVVTLAGDNRGATMHVAGSYSQPTRKKGSIHNIHRTKEEEEEKDEAGKAYVNSNIQSMNNSLMVQGSINGRDPGVRVILPEKPEPQVKQGLENREAEVKMVSRVERLTYQPMVRRRCLRGLLVEPSDSDPDNPDKPRRHGCKVSCGDIRKDNGIL